MIRAAAFFLLIAASSSAYAVLPPPILYMQPLHEPMPLGYMPLPPPSNVQNAQQMNAIAAALAAFAGGNARGGSQSLFGVGTGDHGDELPADADPATYEYPDTFHFGSGKVGAGNVGNGLCTGANSNRTQVKNGYCGMLKSLLEDKDSCAHKAMEQIFTNAGNGQIGDLGNFCSSFSGLSNYPGKEMFIEQLLSAVITRESGWNTSAQEKPWTKNGQPMGGKGLFQIGVNDASRPGCEGINASSIFDAKTNMKCGACIALSYIAKDSAIGNGSGDHGGSHGMAEYYGTLRTGSAQQAGIHDQIASATNMWCSAASGSGGGSQLASDAAAMSSH